MKSVSLRWWLTRALLRPVIHRAVRRGLRNRALTDVQGNEMRWLHRERNAFLTRLDGQLASLRSIAGLDSIPSYGNRLMVELAVYTTAMDRQLRADGIAPSCARRVTADIGWDLYAKSLWWVSLPARLSTRDPGQRLRRTLRLMFRFPFDLNGAPGYAADVREEEKDTLTYFTHCPPQTFVRAVEAETGDKEALEGFRQSWCRYDWPGADIIAGDGERGHYVRRRTLSHGDPVCDMCWAARAHGNMRAHGNEG